MSDETPIPDGVATMPVEDLSALIFNTCAVFERDYIVNAFAVEMKPVEIEEGATSASVYIIVHWLSALGKIELSNVERLTFRIDEFNLDVQEFVTLFKKRLRETYQRSVLMLCVSLLNQPWAAPVLSDLGLAAPKSVLALPGVPEDPAYVKEVSAALVKADTSSPTGA